MIEGIVLGALQGIGEWLPVSSEGLIMLARLHIFHSTDAFSSMVRFALMLHLGTFAAAGWYLRRDLWELWQGVVHWKEADETKRALIPFLIISTIVSGGLGFLLLSVAENTVLALSGRVLTGGIGVLLCITGIAQLMAKKYRGARTTRDLSFKDSIILGIGQGLAVLPGLSRSGMTVSLFLLRGIDDKEALRVSFLMSLPIVLAGNILLNFRNLVVDTVTLWGLGAAFVFGLLSMHALFRVAERLSFGYFMVVFGMLTLISIYV